MAKSTNGGKSEGTSGEAKARRAPGRRRMDRKTTDVNTVAALAPNLARAPATLQVEPPAVSTQTEMIELGGLETVSPEEVQRRAYDIYVSRGGTDGGGTDGGDLEDWYEAERQLRSQTH